MKNWITGLLFLTALSGIALGAEISDDTLKIGKQGSSAAKVIKAGNGQFKYDTDGTWKFSNNAGVDFKAVGSGSGGSGYNMAEQGDFEGATTSFSMVGTGGTFATTSTAANVGFGNKAGAFDATINADALRYTISTIPPGLYGRACVARFIYKGGDTNLVYRVTDGSGNLLANAQTVVAKTAYGASADVGFECPSSGTLRFEIVASANAAVIYVDNVFVGEQVSQNSSTPALWGTAVYPATASCQWNTNATSWTSLTANASCPTPTLTGNATAPLTKIPAILFPSLPAGDYIIQAVGTMNDNTQDTNACYFRVTDGTNHGSTSEAYTSSSNNYLPMNSSLRVSYATTQTNTQFYLQALSDNATNTCYIRSDNTSQNLDLRFYVYRYPSVSEQAIPISTAGASWQGSHGTDCSWAYSTASFGNPTDDGSCTFTEKKNKNFGSVASSGAKGPGITFTPPHLGRYYVCANPTVYSSGAGVTLYTQLTDGTTTIANAQYSVGSIRSTLNMCGFYDATSFSPVTLKIMGWSESGSGVINGQTTASPNNSIEWSLMEVSSQVPVPYVSDMPKIYSNSAAAERIERVAFGGSGTEGASACSSSPCTIYSQSGSWVSSVTRTSTGLYTVNIAAGIFSSKPNCVISSHWGSTSSIQTPHAYASSTTAVTINQRDTTSSPIDWTYDLICMGPK